MKAIAVNGSPRKNGNTYLMLKKVLDELEKRGIGTELIQAGEHEQPLLPGELLVSPGPGAAPARHLTSGEGAIAPILARVARELPADGARVPPQGASDGCLT
jgi:hypothetical protein